MLCVCLLDQRSSRTINKLASTLPIFGVAIAKHLASRGRIAVRLLRRAVDAIPVAESGICRATARLTRRERYLGTFESESTWIILFNTGRTADSRGNF